MWIICINNEVTIPQLQLKERYEVIKETKRSYYIKTAYGVLPYAKKRFFKIIK